MCHCKSSESSFTTALISIEQIRLSAEAGVFRIWNSCWFSCGSACPERAFTARHSEATKPDIDSAAAVCDGAHSQSPKPSSYSTLKESLSLSVQETSSLSATTFRNLPFHLLPSLSYNVNIRYGRKITPCFLMQLILQSFNFNTFGHKHKWEEKLKLRFTKPWK